MGIESPSRRSDDPPSPSRRRDLLPRLLKRKPVPTPDFIFTEDSFGGALLTSEERQDLDDLRAEAGERFHKIRFLQRLTDWWRTDRANMSTGDPHIFYAKTPRRREDLTPLTDQQKADIDLVVRAYDPQQRHQFGGSSTPKPVRKDHSATE